MSGTILEKIIATKRGEVSAAKKVRPMAMIETQIAVSPAVRDFYAAVVQVDSPVTNRCHRLIAEIKKASPSAGLIRADFDPVEIARVYAAHGAAALSVLTDQTYFQGELAFIGQVKKAVPIPVLRKDFIVDEYQVYESRAAGADAILLIAAAISGEEVDAWSRLASSLGMASLIEVHDEEELASVLPMISPGRRTILGLNNRDLRLQSVDLETTRRLAAMLPTGTPFVAESGIKTKEDVLKMSRWGARALLMGEVFMREKDISMKMGELGWGS